MVVAVASGKGGTGKTTVSVNLAYALARRSSSEDQSAGTSRCGVRLLDCDVEEPNAHLFLNPDFTEEFPVTVSRPKLDTDLCTLCGKCVEACRFNALAKAGDSIMIFPELCHSCGVCSYVCPTAAMQEMDTPIGSVHAAPNDTPFFVHGLLSLGEALSPVVVSAVKEYIDPTCINIIDAPPGTGCSVVRTLEGVDGVILVTEPTPFGLYDLKLAVGLAGKLSVPSGIVINRSDGKDSLIEEFAAESGLPILGRIPFKRKFAEAYSQGKLLAEEFPDLQDVFLDLYDKMDTLKLARYDADLELLANTHRISDESTENRAGREIVVISGKGGTGKTTITASLCQLSKNTVITDLDVDAADLHLLINPTKTEAYGFSGGQIAEIDSTKCIGCGECAEECRSNAITLNGPANHMVTTTYSVDPVMCEGCGLCTLVCPADAVHLKDHQNGQWYVSSTNHGTMVHAQLGFAEDNSGKLVTLVRNQADNLSREIGSDLIIGDGPPGTGCPVIASITGADLVVLVTEPTVSGVHDLKRVMQLTAHFQIPMVVIINKADLNSEQVERIEKTAESHGSRVIGHIPFEEKVDEALRMGKTVVEYGDSPAARAINGIWEKIDQVIRALN